MPDDAGLARAGDDFAAVGGAGFFERIGCGVLRGDDGDAHGLADGVELVVAGDLLDQPAPSCSKRMKCLR